MDSVVAIASVVLILALPSMSATFGLEMTPQYSGVTTEVSSSTSASGCHSRARIIEGPFASNKSGHVVSDRRSSASTCPGEEYPQFGTAADAITFVGLNITVPALGACTVSHAWRFSFDASASVTESTSSFAVVIIFAYNFLYIASNQTYFNLGGPGNAVANLDFAREGNHGQLRLVTPYN